ncbi:hypothetical protein CYY_002880 [Polysphondylium violaceum]|uniref:DUF1772 family protein n=1 Tax=Polysphondylium violaceum TaxID=133409 RepID=A0A8J4V6G1_9MYCE|nr:hypothetical protein CYY_002880 [Polysphondylium violaceum]
MKDYQPILKFLAVGASGIFAGQALAISTLTVPRMLKEQKEDSNRAIQTFGEMYGTAAIMQAPLSIISGVAGGLMFYHYCRCPRWLTGSVLAFFSIPFTLLIMAPQVNKELLGYHKGHQQAQPERAKQLLEKWSFLHSIRTVTSLAGFGIMLAIVVL